jgi:hypothetical protein
MFPRNVGSYKNDTVSYPRRRRSSAVTSFKIEDESLKLGSGSR